MVNKEKVAPISLQATLNMGVACYSFISICVMVKKSVISGKNRPDNMHG